MLAPGAGAPHTSPFMVLFGKGLSSRGIDVVTFNFLYQEQRRKVPDRTELLETHARLSEAQMKTVVDMLRRHGRQISEMQTQLRDAQRGGAALHDFADMHDTGDLLGRARESVR